ncbi:hypothetical protein [Phenylobacterium sp.]|uniref:hypothetical protein n=1 Tax=Phenylobacterium sp. TaxID=1871053 RepID=UPI0025E4E60F|nr:hypothetical protein [Phenylobacterium sp.]MBX3482836.1 hypothetical protein [Phenylobacterium sp.]MCW5759408.1 hypothetical protein [Phenylobacterium sp.]
MPASTLDTFIAAIRDAWGPLTSDLVGTCRRASERLARAPSSEPWLAALLTGQPAAEELHRDAERGFVLLAHTEQAGLYRPPHDHGRAWVVYAVQRGEVEMRTFARIAAPDGGVRLVQRDSVVARAGQALAYLPGDIHDTRCLSETALLFRFTERDLKHEDRVESRVARYAAPEDGWASGR